VSGHLHFLGAVPLVKEPSVYFEGVWWKIRTVDFLTLRLVKQAFWIWLRELHIPTLRTTCISCFSQSLQKFIIKGTKIQTYAAHTLQYDAILSLKRDGDMWREVFFVPHPGITLNWLIQKLTSLQGVGLWSFTVCQMIMQLVNKCVSVCLSISSLCLISESIQDMRIVPQSYQFSWNFVWLMIIFNNIPKH